MGDGSGSADVFAASELCRRGLDGVYWTEQLHTYLVAGWGMSWDEGHEVHGTEMQRVKNVRRKATGCSECFGQSA